MRITVRRALAMTAFFMLTTSGSPGGPPSPPPMAKVIGAAPIYKDFKEWVLVCDNTRACFAKFGGESGLIDPDKSAAGYLSISREAGPAGKLVVEIEPLAEKAQTPDPKQLRLDGRRLVGNFAWRKGDGIMVSINSLWLDANAAWRFVQAIRDGTKLTYLDRGAIQVVSLRGMSAALLAMDEAQGRLGNSTALIRIGAAPASAVPAALPIPIVHAVPTKGTLSDPKAFAAAVRAAEHDWLSRMGCNPQQTSEDRAYPFAQSEGFVILGCRMGTSWGSYFAFRAPRDAPEKATQVVMPIQPTLAVGDLAVTDDDGHPIAWGSYYAMADWDPATSTFSESAPGSGSHACGSSTQWVFAGGAFQLATFNRSDKCEGPAGDLPTVYRTQVVVQKAK